MISRLCLLPLLLLFCSSAFAQQWYHVELLVFERLSGEYAEHWPEMSSIREGELTPDMSTTRIQPDEASSLMSVANKLNQASDFSVLYHRAWQQPVLTKRNAKPVTILSEDGLVEGVLELFKLTYLNADIDLWLKQQVPALNTWSDDGETSTLTVTNPHLQEIRRVKSNELIYFDHPRIAAILELTPVETPAAAISETPETYSIPGTN